MAINNIIFRNNELKVTLATTDTEENYTKGINIVAFPKTSGNRITDPTQTNYEENIPKVVDILMKAERRYTIGGHLVTGITDTTVYPSITEKGDATDKKADLRKIFLHGGNFYMYYEGEWLQVNSDKLSIRRVPRDGLENTDGVTDFDVKITVIQVSASYG